MNKKLVKGLTVSSAAVMGMSIVLPTVSVIAAPAATNGWVQSNGTWYYYNNGTMVKNGWAKDSKGWCFLNAIDGSWVQEGWAKDSTGWGYIQNGYWVEHAMYAKDSSGWNFVQANGYWDGKAAVAVNPVAAATAAVEKAEVSKSTTDVNAATILVNALDSAISERAALTTRIAGIGATTATAVASVTVVDATHVQVVFTQNMDETTAEKDSNYKIGSTDIINEAVLQADGKTVILKLANALTNDSSDDYTVKITDVKSEAGKVIDAYKAVLSLYDNVKPTVESVSMTNRDNLKITFNEDVTNANGTNIKVLDADGSQVSVTVTPDATDKNIVNVTGLGAEDDGDYTLSISNVKDLAGNKIVANTEEEFTLEADNTDPSVVSVKAVSLTTLKVTFDEPVDISGGDFNVTATYNGNTLVVDDITAVSGTDKQSFYVTFDTTQNDSDAYKVNVSGYEDFAGNTGDSYTKFIKFGSIAPTLESTEGTIKTFNGDKYVVFTFDEDVNGNINAADVNLDGSYTDEDSDVVDATIAKGDIYDSVTLDELEDNQVAIALGSLEIGDYTVTLPAGFATVNGSESDKTDVTFNVATKVTSDITVDGFEKVGNDVYYVHFSDKVNSSALDASNYEIDGDSVFSSAKFTSTDKDEVKLTVAQGAIENTTALSSSYKFTTTNIVDADGNDVTDFDSNDTLASTVYGHTSGINFDGIEITETTGPNVDSAVLVDLEHITVTFDQAVSGTVDENDFNVTVDGNSVNIDSATSVDGIIWTLTLKDDIDSDYTTVKAGTSSDFDGTDILGNDGITGTMKTVKLAD